ncbi:MAG: 50S ribosomal protein L1 [Armatimonadetes bacterium]|nr:50S ribosomal protein L1 [Armatimonadota bacterium]
MAKHSKRFSAIKTKIDPGQQYSVEDAVKLAKELASAKFDETVEVHIRLGVNPAKSEQQVRGTVVLPHGTGKVPRVVVFAEGEAVRQAEEAGADRVGNEDLIKDIEAGWSDFDILVAQPQLMKSIGRLGKILGPRMPSKKAGTIDTDVAAIVRELKSGRVEYRIDKGGVIHAPIGKVSFTDEQLAQNLYTLLDAVLNARPSGVTGRYIRSLTLSTTMGPGIKIDVDKAVAQAAKAA